MFHIKICGITTVEDARLVALAGADAIGLNFFPPSPRFIEVSTARQIIKGLPSHVKKVGLFVNATHEQISEIAQELSLDLIQLHGDEPPEFLRPIELPIMKAFRIDERGLQPVVDFVIECRALGRVPKLCLLDAFKTGQYGGTGVMLDWKKLATEISALSLQTAIDSHLFPPLILSGGLNSSNVAEAILTVRPVGVDTASGVESSPGRKDPTLVQAFVSSAKSALIQIDRYGQ